MHLPYLNILISASLPGALAVTNGAVSSRNNVSNATELRWGPCDRQVVDDPTLSCSSFEIPLDYHNNSAGTGRVAVAMVNATGNRLGTLFMNPGGPGESGVAGLSGLAPYLMNYTGGLYDLVSWDTRGEGPLTVPGDIDCFGSVEESNAFWNNTIYLKGINMIGNFTDPEDIQTLLSQAPIMERKYQELAQRCLTSPVGKYLQYVGTAATVRDMVALADVIDGPGKPINFYGISYGTVIGSWFMNMFPDRVGRVAIDGIVDTTLLATEEDTKVGYESQLLDSQKVYDALMTGCALAGPEGCAMASNGSSAADVDKTFQDLLKLAHDAQRVNSSVTVTSGIIRSALLNNLYTPGTWSDFVNDNYTAALAAVKAEAQNSSNSSTSYTVLEKRHIKRDILSDPLSLSLYGIGCSDTVDVKGTSMVDIFNEIINVTRSTSHVGAKYPTPWAVCPVWPFRAVERYQGPFNKTLANKVLMLSNTLDPVTSLTGAKAVAKAAGDNAKLVLLAGLGHSTIQLPSKCLDALKLSYFVNGTLPENDTLCEADSDYEIFRGVNAQAIFNALSSGK
ncbi:alpha/beta-hydrolase [Trametes elegans]|nr:alpha/beta-hydrolase [Trametes elegans]